MQSHTLEVPGAHVVYDVRGPLPAADGRPPLLMIGQPMDASGFATLASLFPDRTVVTYDPRGLGRSTRSDGRNENDPEVQAEDLHALVAELGTGPVDLFASSGGAITALAWVTRHRDDIHTLVAHEPPLFELLPDAEAVGAAERAVRDTYHSDGWGAGLARFIAMASWRGEFPPDFASSPAPDPASFGLPAQDDGRRDDPLLSGSSFAVSHYRPDIEALGRRPRVVLAVGKESAGTITARTTEALAAALGRAPVVFPSHHGGFLGEGFGQPGEPEAFAATLREVLDAQQ
jgi:pimeloyl-ACP methyl ester carboxylesterase